MIRSDAMAHARRTAQRREKRRRPNSHSRVPVLLRFGGCRRENHGEDTVAVYTACTLVHNALTVVVGFITTYNSVQVSEIN